MQENGNTLKHMKTDVKNYVTMTKQWYILI